jgi:hypothetical protein
MCIDAERRKAAISAGREEKLGEKYLQLETVLPVIIIAAAIDGKGVGERNCSGKNNPLKWKYPAAGFRTLSSGI